MVLLIFMGTPRLAGEVVETSEPRRVLIPLMVLAIFSFWVWFDVNPLGHHTWLYEYVRIDFMAKAGLGETLVPFLSILLVTTGVVLAYSFFRPGSVYVASYHALKAPETRKGQFTYSGMYLNALYSLLGKGVYRFAALAAQLDKRIVDPFLHFISVGTVVFSKVAALVDRFLVDGPVNGVSALSVLIGKKLANFSSRDIHIQLMWLLFFLILILGWIMLF